MNKHLLQFLKTVGWMLSIIYGLVFLSLIALISNEVEVNISPFYLDYVLIMITAGVGLIRATRL